MAFECARHDTPRASAVTCAPNERKLRELGSLCAVSHCITSDTAMALLLLTQSLPAYTGTASVVAPQSRASSHGQWMPFSWTM